MHYVTITEHSPSDMSDGVHKKQRHTPRHVSGRLSSFCCLLTSQTNLHKQFWYHQSVTGLAGVGTRLYGKQSHNIHQYWVTVITALLGLNSMDTVYEQLSLIIGLRHRQLFVHNIPVSATAPFDPTNFGFKTKLNIVWPSDYSPSYHVWSAELGTTRVFTHACIWQVEHATSPPSPNMGSMPGTTSSYHDVIIWGPPFCISCSQ